MKKQTIGLFFLILTLSVAPAYAVTVQGTVVSVDSSGQTVTIDPGSGNSLPGAEAGGGNIQLRLTPGTQFTGFGSLADVEVGDLITVQATQPVGASGAWQVQMFQSLGRGNANPNAGVSGQVGVNTSATGGPSST